MATTVTIGADAGPLQKELAKTQQAVGKATAGIGKGLATSIGSSLGPFGELIEKADAFTASIGAASAGTKVFAAATGIAFAATAFLVSKAIDGWKEMTAAIEDSVRAARQLEKARSQIGRNILTSGVAAGQEGAAMSAARERAGEIRNRLRSLVTTNEDRNAFERLFGLNEGRALKPEEVKALQTELRELEDVFGDLSSGAATLRGEARLFNATISPEARKAREEERIRQRAAGLSDSDVATLRAQREQMQGLLGQQPETQAGGITSNVLTRSIGDIDALLKAREALQGAGAQLRFAPLTAVGGGGIPASVQGRENAARQMVEEQKETNRLLQEALRKTTPLL